MTEILIAGLVIAILVVTIILGELVFHWFGGGQNRRPKLPIADTRDVARDPKRGDVIFWASGFWMYDKTVLPGVCRVFRQHEAPDSKTIWKKHELIDKRTWAAYVRDGRVVAKESLVVEEQQHIEAAPPTDLEAQRKKVAYRYNPDPSVAPLGSKACAYCGSAHPAKGPCSFRDFQKDWDRDDR
jgi:hypothetical protein